MAARSSAPEKTASVMDLTLRGGTTGAGLGRARWRGIRRTRRSSLLGPSTSRAVRCEPPNTSCAEMSDFTTFINALRVLVAEELARAAVADVEHLQGQHAAFARAMEVEQEKRAGMSEADRKGLDELEAGPRPRSCRRARRSVARGK